MPLRNNLPPSLAEEMPPPSVELMIIGVILRAYLMTISPKKRRAFLTNVMATWELLEERPNVVRLRGREHDEATAIARRQGVAWTRGMMAAFLARDI